MIAHFYLHPYVFHGSNMLEDTVYIGTLSIFFLSILYRANDDLADDTSFQITFTALALLIELITIIVCFAFAVTEIRQVLRLKKMKQQATRFCDRAANDPRELMAFATSLMHQHELPRTSVNWLTHAAKTDEKVLLRLFFEDLAPVVNKSTTTTENIVSFGDVSILGNSIAKVARYLSNQELLDRKAIRKWLQNLHQGRYKPYFFDGTDPAILSDWILQSQDTQLILGFKMLVGSMQNWHLKEQFAETLRKVPIFKDCDREFIQTLVLQMIPHSVQPGVVVCKRGSVGGEMYFINRGVMEVMNPETGGTLRELKDGDYFGEIALLLEKQPRTADVVATTFCDLYVLTKRHLDTILPRFPEIRQNLAETARKRMAELVTPKKDKEGEGEESESDDDVEAHLYSPRGEEIEEEDQPAVKSPANLMLRHLKSKRQSPE